VLAVTGKLGGSLRGRHLTFKPRVWEARRMAEDLGPDLHALIDISDGLSLDLARMCEASGVGARLDEALLRAAISTAAEAAAAEDGRTAQAHALEDGEDFELLAAIAPQAATDSRLAALGLIPVGVVTGSGLELAGRDGAWTPLDARGYDHFDG
jgi:thiamine-monophosphate kinase